ncbi:DMT family transporter [Lyngbya confervoides]|uniref:DMT family transporter n=1 Tax=Lyngbya confervoides BDU141951 TaxID=1574623 RepID=A0ABD4T0U1_9CYAN|nr:DMT family transporter [Lyngbya confervoides]MCM1982261.1 DMT family transporter [Lyngbya confervoides BDU141951]
MTGPAQKNVALLQLWAGATCIAFAPILVRWSPVGPTATAFYRLALALPWLATWHWQDQSRPTRPSSSASLWTGSPAWPLALSGLFFAADLALWHQSIALTSVANATLLANFAPVFVVAGSWILWRERVALHFWGALALVLAGMSLLASASWEVSSQRLLGDALGLLTAVFYAGYILTVSHLRSRHRTARVALWSSGIGALVLGLLGLLAGESFWPQTSTGWILLGSLALISQVLGQSLIAAALAHLPPSFSAVGLMLQPAIATVLAWHFFGESLTPSQGVGAILLLIGIYWARKLSIPQPESIAPLEQDP